MIYDPCCSLSGKLAEMCEHTENLKAGVSKQSDYKKTQLFINT